MGRSNVGKSSLINALARRPIARTSAAPGKTRLANFYRVQRGSAAPLYLVDLPGYGYARGGDASTAAFERLTGAYFSRAQSGIGTGASELDIGGTAAAVREARRESRIPRPVARVRIGVLLLVDSRHPGLASDLEAWRWLRQQPPAHGIVGTKVDKLTRAERARHGRELDSLFETHVPLVSADTGEGLEALWKLIVTLPKEPAA